MRTAAYNDDVASGLRSTSVVAKRASQALSNAAGARMCQGTFYVLHFIYNNREMTRKEAYYECEKESRICVYNVCGQSAGNLLFQYKSKRHGD